MSCFKNSITPMQLHVSLLGWLFRFSMVIAMLQFAWGWWWMSLQIQVCC